MTIKATCDHELSKFALDEDNNSLVRVLLSGGQGIDPLAKFVEAIYTSGDTVVTYSYYESSSKATLYTTITVTYTSAQDTTFTSAEWS